MQKKLRIQPANAILWVLLATGCVDTFDGSIVQVDFGAFLPPQARPGATPAPGFQLPSNSHYRLYGIVDGTQLTELARFKVRPVVELGSPCFIDPEGTRFPGIHVTQFARRMAAETGITDIANPPPGTSEEAQIDQATAIARVAGVLALGRPINPGSMPDPDPGALKAVTSAESAPYPQVGAACVEDDATVSPDLIPPPNCIGDQSNANRLRLCNQFWAANPGFYEGSDRVLTQPLNGTYFGTVPGVVPSSGATVGGAQLLIAGSVRQYSTFAFSAHTDDTEAPPLRQVLLGQPSSPARGVIRVQLGNFEATVPAALKPGFASQMVIFENVGEDNVHF